jgi:L-ascorbate metabolism protein UlaG (beta-lactamase superfamily)
MIKRLSIIAVALLAMTSCKNGVDKEPELNAVSTEVAANTTDADKIKEKEAPDLKITPISHATFLMEWDGMVFYIDPVGGADLFKDFPTADYVLVTDIHGDHMDQKTLDGVVTENTKLIFPKAVKDNLVGFESGIVINNGEDNTYGSVNIAAVPMYNLTEERLKFHDKGRGNGYVITMNDYSIYISGDTEDIPEMRALENIDLAFVCMNLPYTMVVAQAASAVLEFKPRKVIPYHYRGTDGFLDVEQFKFLVNAADPDIEVELMEWYPQN